MRTLVAECKIPSAPSRYEEVETMAESIGYEVIDTIVQHRKNLHHTYCIGPGKLEEIKMLVAENDIEAVVFANTLPSAQVFKIQRVLGGTDIKVIDRNLLILEVFDKRAMTKEAKLQIALAGYTQSGKTTFFNRMSAEHKDTGLGPFTTLSTFARRIDQNNGGDNFSFILIDSIGFIEDMHPIILKAFNTTLGEITNADLILLFVDVSEDLESVFRKVSASKEILRKIATKVPLVICANKTDLCNDDRLEEGKKLISRTFEGIPLVELSALKGNNTDEVVKQAYHHLNGASTSFPP